MEFVDPSPEAEGMAGVKRPLSSRIHYYDKKQLTTSEAILARLATRSSLTPNSSKLILSMVGLPARGKVSRRCGCLAATPERSTSPPQIHVLTRLLSPPPFAVLHLASARSVSQLERFTH